MRKLRIGTRGSALALAQTRLVSRALKSRHPGLKLEIVKIKTEGDEFKTVQIFKKSNVGVFTKRIERALLEGRVDLAVHSLKDLPTKLARGLALAAVPKRASVSDALISRGRHTLDSLPRGAKVGTGSPRRARQIFRLRPDLKIVALRGNLDTRVRRVLRERTLDGIVVARSGLERLRRFQKHWRAIDERRFLPAVGQGALAIQTRANDAFAKKIAFSLNDAVSETLASAEREFLNRLGGGCRVPVGILSKKSGARVSLRAAVYSTRTTDFVEDAVERPWKAARSAARELASRLLRRGARRFLAEARHE